MRRPSFEVIEILGLGVIDSWLDADPPAKVREGAPIGWLSRPRTPFAWVDYTGKERIHDLAQWLDDRADRKASIQRLARDHRRMGRPLDAARVMSRMDLRLNQVPFQSELVTRFYGIRPWRRNLRGRHIHAAPRCA